MRRFLAALLPILLLSFCCLTQASCAPRGSLKHPAESLNPPEPQGLVLLRSGKASPKARASGSTAFLSVLDPQESAGQYAERQERHLKARGFGRTTQPSKADRIITVKILYRGEGSREAMERAVRAGYGSRLPAVSGEGAVLVADLLLVRRKVPGGHVQMRNISARNTVSSSTLRIGLSAREQALTDRGLEEALADDVAGLAASDEEDAVRRQDTAVSAGEKSGRSVRKKARTASRSKASRRSGKTKRRR